MKDVFRCLKKGSLFFPLLLALAIPVIAHGQAEPIAKILSFLDHKTANFVLIEGGVDHNLTEGMILHSFRDASQNSHEALIETGSVKLIQVENDFSIGEVLTQGSNISKKILPDFSGIMAGDFLTKSQYTIRTVTQTLPEVEIKFYELFKDPGYNPKTFELSEEGKTNLLEIAKIWLEVKMPLLLVEGHTDYHGSTAENQTESYQRALAVKQFLVDNLKFSDEKLVPLGFGESNTADTSFVSGHIQNNRRIIIKAISP